MTEAVVILTYPGHYLLTALTIKSYLKYHNTTDFIVVADDISQQAWPTYINDCQELYSSLTTSVKIIPASTIPEAHEFSGIGWVRQQIIKLHLDQIIDQDTWFFTDGDIVFLHTVDPTEIPYSVPYYNDTTRQQNEYVKLLLGQDSTIQVDGQQVCVSNPAFRTMEKTVLQQLRAHVEQLHQTSLVKIHQQFLSNSMGVSEWELIENFKQHVLGKQLKLIKYAPHDISDINADLNFFTHQFLTCYNADKDFGREWFADQSIDVSDKVWQILSNINR